MPRGRAAVLLSLGFTLPVACSEAPPATPAVRIVAPTMGARTGGELEVRLSSSGVRVVPATGTAAPGEAHLHLFLDTDLPADLTQPVGQGQGILHLGTGDSVHAYTGLAPGRHRIIALLATGDHVPMAGAASDTVEFEVE